MPDITPPQISDGRLNELRQAENGALNFVTLREFRVIARAVIAERDRQWLERLEPVQWLNCTAQSDLHPEPPKLILQQGATLYRIKEQG